MAFTNDRFPSSPPSPSTDPADPDGSNRPRRGQRPIPPGVEYHRMLAGDKRRIGRGVLAIALLLAGLYGFSFVLAIAAGSIDLKLGNSTPALGGTEYTPLYHGANMVTIALLIPWSMVIQRWLYGVKGASLHSVLSRFRFDLFGRALLLIGPFWLISSVVVSVLMPKEQIGWAFADLAVMFVLVILFTPLQSAGEEYGLRGLVFQVAGSWSRGRRAGLVLAVVVSTLVFAPIHLSTDPWLNLWYLTLAFCLAIITWRTGGLEVAVVIHALNNTFIFLFDTVMHSDFAGNFERSSGSGSAALLVYCLAVVAVTVVVWIRTRATGPALTPADAQSAPQSAPRPERV